MKFDIPFFNIRRFDCFYLSFSEIFFFFYYIAYKNIAYKRLVSYTVFPLINVSLNKLTNLYFPCVVVDTIINVLLNCFLFFS